MAVATVGASLTLAVRTMNSSATKSPARSVAVTLTVMEPTSALAGVPLKEPSAASKVSQVGRAEPLARVALRVSVSPASTSAKVPVGSVKEKAASSVAL